MPLLDQRVQARQLGQLNPPLKLALLPDGSLVKPGRLGHYEIMDVLQLLGRVSGMDPGAWALA